MVKTTTAEANNYLEMKLYQFSIVQETREFPEKGFAAKLHSETQLNTELQWNSSKVHEETTLRCPSSSLPCFMWTGAGFVSQSQLSSPACGSWQPKK